VKYTHPHQQEFEIRERLVATFHAECDRCSYRQDLDAVDEEGAAMGFYADGWRVIAIDIQDPVADQLVCKKCFAEGEGQ